MKTFAACRFETWNPKQPTVVQPFIATRTASRTVTLQYLSALTIHEKSLAKIATVRSYNTWYRHHASNCNKPPPRKLQKTSTKSEGRLLRGNTIIIPVRTIAIRVMAHDTRTLHRYQYRTCSTVLPTYTNMRMKVLLVTFNETRTQQPSWSTT